MKHKKRKLIVFLSGVLALVLVVGSLAYYTSTNVLDNQLETKKYGDVLKEKFTPDLDWEPGEEVTKEVGVTNTGDYDLVLRIKLNETWSRNGTVFKSVDSTGNSIYTPGQANSKDGLTPATDKTVVEKTLVRNNWVRNDSDGYWYYTIRLTPGATAPFMTKIKLIEDADMGKYNETKYYYIGASEPTAVPPASPWTLLNENDPYPTVTNPTDSLFFRSVSQLASNARGYSEAVYDLYITAETCQATQAAVDATFGTSLPAGLDWNLN